MAKFIGREAALRCFFESEFPVFIVVNQAFAARSRQHSKKSAGLARLTRAFFSDFNAEIAAQGADSSR